MTPEPKLCECGCGEPAPISKYNSKPAGYVKGEPRRFISGHNNARSGVEYVVDENGCWTWQRFRNPAGYGMKRYKGQARLAHRVFYMEMVGPIPDGLVIDHLCRNRACVNPEHMEPVTPRENTLRGETLAASYLARTHCKDGHPLAGDNLYLGATGARYCRKCRGMAPRKAA